MNQDIIITIQTALIVALTIGNAAHMYMFARIGRDFRGLKRLCDAKDAIIADREALIVDLTACLEQQRSYSIKLNSQCKFPRGFQMTEEELEDNG